MKKNFEMMDMAHMTADKVNWELLYVDPFSTRLVLSHSF